MRGLLTVILFIILFFSFSIAAYTYSINLVFTADYVKGRLDESKIYSAVANELPNFIGRSPGEEDGLVPKNIKKELHRRAIYRQTFTAATSIRFTTPFPSVWQKSP